MDKETTGKFSASVRRKAKSRKRTFTGIRKREQQNIDVFEEETGTDIATNSSGNGVGIVSPAVQEGLHSTSNICDVHSTSKSDVESTKCFKTLVNRSAVKLKKTPLFHTGSLTFKKTEDEISNY